MSATEKGIQFGPKKLNLHMEPGVSRLNVYTLLFGILLVPYRLLRRGSRKRKQEMLRHAEVLAAIENQNTQTIYN